MKKYQLYTAVLVFILFFGVMLWDYFSQKNSSSSLPKPTTTTKTTSSGVIISTKERVNSILRDTEVQNTITRIQKSEEKYIKDGAFFTNKEKILPVKRDRSYYHEWTVKTPGSRDRGARRIIEGKGGELYFTDDHYESFTQIR